MNCGAYRTCFAFAVQFTRLQKATALEKKRVSTKVDIGEDESEIEESKSVMLPLALELEKSSLHYTRAARKGQQKTDGSG